MNTFKQLDALVRNSSALSALPPLSETEISAFERTLSVGLPEDIRDLLRHSGGVQLDIGQVVVFTGTGDVGFGNAIPRPVPVMGDGFGNFWVVDVLSSGEWGAVLYVSHDPPVLAVQAASLGSFIEQIGEFESGRHEDTTNYVRNQAVTHIWNKDPFVVPVPAARQSGDAVVTGFASELPYDFNLADLRSKEPGIGFRWGHTAPEEIRRGGDELLFGLPRKESSFFQRIFGRKS